MESLGILLIGFGISLIVIVNLKRYFDQRSAAKSIQKEFQTNPNLEDLQKKNDAILSSLEKFLKSSRFYEITGKRGDDKIYQYILNNGKLYQFDGFQTPNNLKVGIDEDFLLFRGLSYKRATDTREFSKKFLNNEVLGGTVIQP